MWTSRLPPPCACRETCGDVPEEDDPDGTCKGLPQPPKPPLIEIVLIDRRTGEVVGRG